MESKKNVENLKENERMVWVQNGKDIMNKTVVIGDADATNTEIVSGINDKDVVILELKSLSDNAVNGATEKSPFMPSFRGKKR